VLENRAGRRDRIVKKYILYGTGLEGEKLLYRCYDIIDEIVYCVDSFHKGVFHGIPIVTLAEAGELNSYTILVAAIWPTYQKIKRILEKRGMKEYTDFFWASEFRKRLVVINANCHGTALIRYLNSNSQFTEQFCIHPVPQIHANSEGELAANLLHKADVYIHQDIRVDNEFGYKLSDEYTMSLLKKDCLNITIPNFVGMGDWLFPTLISPEKKLATSEGEIRLFYGDRAIDEAWRNLGVAPLKQYILFYNNYLIGGDHLESEKEIYIKKLRMREKNWDIKIVDFIENNFQSIPCFVDCSHPSHYLMAEVCRQVAALLGIESVEDNCFCAKELGNPVPILKCVRDYYGLEWDVPSYKQENVFLGYHADINLAEYIKEYVWWFYGIVLDEKGGLG